MNQTQKRNVRHKNYFNAHVVVREPAFTPKGEVRIEVVTVNDALMRCMVPRLVELSETETEVDYIWKEGYWVEIHLEAQRNQQGSVIRIDDKTIRVTPLVGAQV